jgi:hypothetical protein
MNQVLIVPGRFAAKVQQLILCSRTCDHSYNGTSFITTLI